MCYHSVHFNKPNYYIHLQLKEPPDPPPPTGDTRCTGTHCHVNNCGQTPDLNDLTEDDECTVANDDEDTH